MTQPDVTTPNKHSVVVGWLVIGLILITFPVQAAWYLLKSSEPYPALTQPPFKAVYGRDGIYSDRSVSLFAILSDGSAVPINLGETGLTRHRDNFFPEGWNQAPVVIDFLSKHPDLDQQSKQQLRTEITRILPGVDVSYLKIDIQQHAYNLKENRSYPSSPVTTTLVDLRNVG